MLRLLRFVFWAAAVVAFVLAVIPHPPQVPVWDKLQHMAGFFVIALLGCAAYPRASRLKLMVALIAFGGLIEIVQAIPALHRDSDWHDWLADIVATVVALACVMAAQRIGVRHARSEAFRRPPQP
ncbi:MAG: hypothetical protein J2O44_02360 [Porphyrobacter sp.]|nr:hypothetical protein [Porphyrobacter sp.]